MPTPAPVTKTFRPARYKVSRVVARLMTMRYGVLLSLTSRAGSHAVEPLGRCASRTRTQPGLVATTGRTERAPYQVGGTRPAAVRPGLANRGTAPLSVASSVLPAGCRAGPAAGGRAAGDRAQPPASRVLATVRAAAAAILVRAGRSGSRMAGYSCPLGADQGLADDAAHVGLPGGPGG